MRSVIVLFVLFAPTTLAREPSNEEAVQAELKKLSGDWEGYAVEGFGENPNRGPVHLRLSIRESTMSAVDLANGNKEMGNGTFKIELAKPTKTIDATGIILPGKRERNFLGIYELDGDTLKWCVDNRQKERPTEFRTHGGKYLLILKRTK